MNYKHFFSLSAIWLLLGLNSIQSQARAEVQKRTLFEVAISEDASQQNPAQFSENGKLFAVLLFDENTTTFRAVDVPRSVQIASWKLRYLTHFALSPDGRSVATISGGRQRRGIGYGFAVEVRDLRTGAKKRTLVPTGSIYSAFSAVAWSKDGAKIAVGGGDGRVRVFDLRTAKQQIYLAPGSFTNALAFSPDGRFLAAGGQSDRQHISLYLWTLQTGRVARVHYTEKLRQTLSLTFSRDGRRLFTRRVYGEVVGRGPGTVIYALPSLTPIRLFQPLPGDSEEFTSQQIAISPRGDRFAFAGSINVSLGNAKNTQITKRYQFAPDVDSTESVIALSFAPDGILRWVTATFIGNNHRFTLWNARERQ